MNPRPTPGGRILGSAAGRRSLSPAITSAGRISPSASSVSLNSDFGSLRDGGAPSVSGGDTLTCPICSEEMVTLLQLNRHIDDIHKELDAPEKDDISTWFRKRIIKAKTFQPVTVLNQKLKGLDVFESNDAPSPTTNGGGGGGISSLVAAEAPDPDLAVTRHHWQRSTNDDYCLDPMCQKPLGALNGSVNCRKCGRLFCEEHTMYQIKLSRSAQHEPVRGFWCRVCETCYKSREGYNDHQGLVRDHTAEFAAIRRKTVDRAYLEVTRLEKRLTKLTQLLVAPAQAEVGAGSGFIKAVASLRGQRRALEQSVVAWEEDADVPVCPYCKQTFSQFGLKRHHCRLCGKVVCGDLRTGCSTEVGLNVSANAGPNTPTTNSLSEKPPNDLSLDLRICTTCNTTVFSKRDFALSTTRSHPSTRTYSALVQFQTGIKTMMPRFQRLLAALQDPTKTQTSTQLLEATKTRKRLLDTFAQYDAAAKRMLALPTDSPTQARLQKAVHQAAALFLHLNMLPLKALPKVLGGGGGGGGNGNGSKSKRASAAAVARVPGSAVVNGGAAAVVGPSSSRALTMVSVAAAAPKGKDEEDDAREKEMKEELMVLEEQRFLVGEMLAEAKARGVFDEVAALAGSLEELDREVERVGGLIAEFEMGR
ncbi:hypothetical protein P167DRAFT_607133 [Morchella conica CCBAS932]|uniref:FYVE-type domain-containing protein n=1 Tax=Morchella conica CCBAS932 TaxID=1392247 RepID=A0A3N4KJ67_9PEZI|nr:hypothetical protein P167DRAFT_607133 [Morchella conica CCBAS932]